MPEEKKGSIPNIISKDLIILIVGWQLNSQIPTLTIF